MMNIFRFFTKWFLFALKRLQGFVIKNFFGHFLYFFFLFACLFDFGLGSPLSLLWIIHQSFLWQWDSSLKTKFIYQLFAVSGFVWLFKYVWVCVCVWEREREWMNEWSCWKMQCACICRWWDQAISITDHVGNLPIYDPFTTLIQVESSMAVSVGYEM